MNKTERVAACHSQPFYAKDKCERCYWRDYRASHPEYVARQRAYREAHKPQTRAAQSLWRERNRERENARVKTWDAAHPSRRQVHRRKAVYGLTEDAYQAMVANQGGRCAICPEIPEKGLVVDHDHLTGQARALLCRSCNTAVGLLGEDIPRIQRVIAYLGGAR